MNKIPTAEELAIKMFIKHPESYSAFNRVAFTGKQLKEVAIEFAKLHVKAALEAASEKATVDVVDWEDNLLVQKSLPIYGVDSKSILSSYPEELIK